MDPTLSPREIAKQQTRDMAAAIYTELACRVTLATAQPNHPKPDPVRLAKISFALADAFQKVEDERNQVKSAATDKFELSVSDMEGWFSKDPTQQPPGGASGTGKPR